MLLALSSRFHNYLFLSLLQIRMQGLQTSGPLIEFLDLLTNIHFHLVKSLSLFVFHPSSGYISTANKNSSSPSLYYFPFLAWIPDVNAVFRMIFLGGIRLKGQLFSCHYFLSCLFLESICKCLTILRFGFLFLCLLCSNGLTAYP